MNAKRDILRIAVPAIVSNITVPLLGLIDMTIVGHLGKASYIAAIAIGSMVFNVMYWLFGFLRMTTSGLTSQALGARRSEETRLLLRQSLRIALTIAAVLLALQIPIRWLALLLMQPGDDVASLVTTYFNICIWGAPAVLALYSLNGWFIGMQNSRIPMTVSITQNLVNILASLTFVYGFGMRIEGVALGTLVAQYAGVALAGVYAKRKTRFSLPHRENQGGGSPSSSSSSSSFFRHSSYIFLRTLCLVAVNLFITSAGSWQGETVLAVNAVLMQLFLVYSYFIDGFAYAGEAICGKYHGAGDTVSLRRTIRQLFGFGLVIAALFTLLFALFLIPQSACFHSSLGMMEGAQSFLLSLFTSSPDVLRLAPTYLPWLLAVPFAGMAAFLWDGIFIGITASRSMLTSTLVGSLVFFTVYLLLPHLLPLGINHILWLAFISYLLARGLTQTFLFRQR